MFFIVGIIIVFGSVFGGYSIVGDLGVLWQPVEFLIILGGGIGAFVVANPKAVLIGSAKSVGTLLKGPAYKKDHYIELLSVLYSTFKLAKSKGDLALEAHVENPHDSALFGAFPKFQHDHHACEFFCDYLRLLTLGANTPHEVEAVMDEELEIHHAEQHAISSALQAFADAVPALGIVAAVLGVIVTMSSITEPPEILGHLIAAALVGTFFGIFMSYGVLAPMASSLGAIYAADGHYMQCIKIALIGHMQGYAPQVSVEFARKSLSGEVRPTFAEVEEILQNLPPVG